MEDCEVEVHEDMSLGQGGGRISLVRTSFVQGSMYGFSTPILTPCEGRIKWNFQEYSAVIIFSNITPGSPVHSLIHRVLHCESYSKVGLWQSRWNLVSPFIWLNLFVIVKLLKIFLLTIKKLLSAIYVFRPIMMCGAHSLHRKRVMHPCRPCKWSIPRCGSRESWSFHSSVGRATYATAISFPGKLFTNRIGSDESFRIALA